MRMYTLVCSTKLVLLVFLCATLGAQSLVYANNMESNQCAKLFEVQKQKPSFKDFVRQRIRAAQEADAKSGTDQKAEDEKQKENERRKCVAIVQSRFGFQIKLIKIRPRKFIMGEGKTAKKVEIRNPYWIMDRTMTQQMYAGLMELMGFVDIEDVFPSPFMDGKKSIQYIHNKSEIPMRPDDPVTKFSWDDINELLLPKLNKLGSNL